MTDTTAGEGVKTCACVNVEFGSYDNYVELFAPEHLKRDDGRGICVDACLALEITNLWKEGIHTTGCCCGHGRLEPTICVTEASVPAMEAIGYVRTTLPTASPTFTAKTGWPLAAQPSAGAQGEAETLRVLLDNLVISQSLSRALREKATDDARSYLYDLRQKPSGHTSKCWGRTSYSDEVVHCYCATPAQPSAAVLQAVASFQAVSKCASGEPIKGLHQRFQAMEVSDAIDIALGELLDA